MKLCTHIQGAYSRGRQRSEMAAERRDYGSTLVDESESQGCAEEADDRLTGKDDEDYDPHLHRKIDRPTNNLESLVHLLKCSLGTGILAMPQAFARAGVVTGGLGTLLAGVLVTHCLHMLVKAQYEQARRARVPLMSYPAAAAAALAAGPPALRPLARPAALTVDLFLVVYQLGICCVYIVFIADNIKKLVDPYYAMSVEYHMLIILGPLIAFNLIPNLKILAPFSALANILTLVGLAIVIYFLLAEPRKSDAAFDLWGSPAQFPLFFGTVLFALTAVGVVVAIENNMKTPKKFGGGCGVLNVGMGLIVVLYLSMGIIGYNFCRDSCSDSITLDMPKDSWLASVVVVMFTVAIFISYGLQCYVPVEVVWTYVRPRLAADAPERRITLAKYAVRIVLALITFVAAVSVPRLGLFISLFGALCLSALGLVFPAMMQALATRVLLTRLKDLVIAVVGLVLMVTGTYSAVDAIVRSFQ